MKPRIAASNFGRGSGRTARSTFHAERFPRGEGTDRQIYGNGSPISEQTFGAAFTHLRSLLEGAGKPDPLRVTHCRRILLAASSGPDALLFVSSETASIAAFPCSPSPNMFLAESSSNGSDVRA